MRRDDGKTDRISSFIARFALPIVVVWLFAAVGLSLVSPPFEDLLMGHDKPLFPTNTVSQEALVRMGKAFGEAATNNEAAVIVEKNKPFDSAKPGAHVDADRQYQLELLHRLTADSQHVKSVFDTWSDPQLAAITQSPDKELTFLRMDLAGDVGTPTGLEAVQAVQKTIDSIPQPAGTTVYLTGTSQGAVDEINAVLRDITRLAAISIVLIAALLLIVYRSVAVAVLPLVTVGLALGVANPVVNLLVQAGELPTSLLTNALMGALMMGAGADYAIFFIGRYQEERRDGKSVDDAYRIAYRAVAPVVVASGLTVSGGLACMEFAQLDLLKAIGLPCAVGFAIATLAALTVAPAVIFLGAKRFGLFEPNKRGTSATFWRRIGVRVARWPKLFLAAASFALVLFMLTIPSADFNYDEAAFIPKDLESAKGLTAMQEHFPSTQLYPDTVLIQSTHDLRNSTDIAVLEQVARKINQLPDVNGVQWITRPTGIPLSQMSLGYGLDYAGKLLSQNSVLIKSRVEQMHKLIDNLTEIIGTVDDLQGKLASAQQQTGTLKTSSGQITSNLTKLNNQMKVLKKLIKPTVDTTTPNPKDCLGDLECLGASKLGRGALSDLAGVDQLTKGVQQVTKVASSLGDDLAGSAGSIPMLTNSLVQLRDTAIAINTTLDPFVSQLDLISYLMQDVGKSSAGTGTFFYFPAALLNDPRIKPYARLVFSPDGKSTRMIVMGKSSSYSSTGMARVQQLVPTVQAALKDTLLAGSAVSVSGVAATVSDTHTILKHDEKIVLVAALTVIFTVLLVLLRSVVAAVVVIASVLVSFLSTLGLSVLVWQDIFGVQLHWAVPAAVFAVLISVGADYNLLIAWRFKEEVGAGVRTGVIQSIAGTGGVVTTAGLVFALTMFSFLDASLVHLSQIGFTIGMGLIIDTFVVRTCIVPALAVILGEKFWWPLRLRELK